jgi:excisionase family DNA binding protein
MVRNDRQRRRRESQEGPSLRELVRLLAKAAARAECDVRSGLPEDERGCCRCKGGRDYLTIDEVALKLRVTPRTVRNWIKAQRLAAKRVGGVVRILSSDLERAIKSNI